MREKGENAWKGWRRRKYRKEGEVIMESGVAPPAAWWEGERRTGSGNSPTDSRKFSTKEIMGAESFDFAPKFS